MIPATRLIRVSRSCSQPHLQWRDPAFLQSGVRMGAIHRRHMITTDALMTGWGVVFEGRPASGEWTGEFLSWHINCLELRAVFLALMHFLPVLGEHHIIVRTDNMAVVSHINRQGGSRSRTLDRLAHRFLLWSQDKYLSLRGMLRARSGNAEPCGRFSVETETQAGRVDVEPSDGIPDMESVWQSGSGPLCFSRDIPMPALVFLKLPDDSGHRCIRPSVAKCQSVHVSASKADSGSPMQSKGERCPSPSHSPILALPDLVLGANSPPVSAPLGDSDQAGPAVPASGQDLASSTRALEVVVMAHTELDEVRLGRHRMVSAFMRGVRRLRATRPMAVPSWDLSVILEGLVTAPFEPLESAPERILTLKVTLLLALTSLKRVGDLQALSVSEMCMDFAPGLVKVTLRPRPGYIPKVLSTSFRSQVVTLHSFHPPPFALSEDEKLHMLFPVRSLKLYVDRSKVWRKSSQLLVCFGAGHRGLATSKQRISHWVRDAISLAYETQNLPSPLSLRAHSTRGVASSQALFRGVPLEDICVAAGWYSSHTFVRFYNLDIDTAPGSQVLSV